MKKRIVIVFFFLLIRAIAYPLHFVVTLNTDNNPMSPLVGELRWAIQQANATPGLDNIDFLIVGGTPQTITLSSFISITDAVIIDGSTQPIGTYTGAEPHIWISGNGTLTQGLYLNASASGSTIQNTLFFNFPHNPTFSVQIYLDHSSNNNILNNVLYGGYDGIFAFGNSNNNQFKGNIFGTNHTLSTVSTFALDNAGIDLQGDINSLAPHFNIVGSKTNPTDINRFYNQSTTYLFSGAIACLNPSANNSFYENLFINNVININNGNGGNNYKGAPFTWWGYFQNNATHIKGISQKKDRVEIFKSNAGGGDAVTFLGAVTTANDGIWTFYTGALAAGDKFIGTATDTVGNTSNFGGAFTVTNGKDSCRAHMQNQFPNSGHVTSICKGKTFSFMRDIGFLCGSFAQYLTFFFGDGSMQVPNIGCPISVSHVYQTVGTYTFNVTFSDSGCIANHAQVQILNVTNCDTISCKNCIGSFAPEQGKKFLVSAWVKESGAPATKTSYTNPQIYIEFPSLGPGATLGPYSPTGAIIDGWQRIEQVFVVPINAADIKLKLVSLSGDCFFDDVRVFPFDGSMKSYVYDPVSMRLVAELDERNYATKYEYDEEGKLIRVKKETEKGTMTIKENKNFIKKR
jgi:parallel beta-helix repeat protein